MEWVKCASCGDEVSYVVDGKCLYCRENGLIASQAEDRKREFLTKMLGKKGFEEFTFDRLAKSPENEAAIHALRGFEPGKENIYLWGDTGSGKTHLAYAAAREAYERGSTILVYKTTDILRQFRGKDAAEETAMMDAFVAVDVLVIDDLGVGRSTEFANQILYEIVDKRIMDMRNGLLVTSNLSLSDVAAKMDDSRLADRLAGLCEFVKLSAATSWRVRGK